MLAGEQTKRKPQKWCQQCSFCVLLNCLQYRSQNITLQDDNMYKTHAEFLHSALVLRTHTRKVVCTNIKLLLCTPIPAVMSNDTSLFFVWCSYVRFFAYLIFFRTSEAPEQPCTACRVPSEGHLQLQAEPRTPPHWKCIRHYVKSVADSPQSL